MTPFLVETPFVSLAVTAADDALTRIRLGARAPRPAESTLERLIAHELAEYFEGTRTRFTVPMAPEGTAFQLGVWNALEQIPYGETRTYGDIAKAVGNPGASRAVGMANHHNPIPILIPCHRVVATGGKLGGFGGGVALKRRLLQLEAEHSALFAR
jgi:methylated-DNA-[protein]-cysteine S-methyltransferase